MLAVKIMSCSIVFIFRLIFLNKKNRRGGILLNKSNKILTGAFSRANDDQSTQLQWIRLSFEDTARCAAFYANFSASLQNSIRISNFQLCVQGRESGDACSGGE